MQKLAGIAEHLSAALVMASPADPVALAEIDRHLRALDECLVDGAAIPEAARAALSDATEKTHELLTKIQSAQADDPAASFGQMTATISEIQRLVQAAIEQPAGVAAEPKPKATGIRIGEEDIPVVKEFIAEAMGHLDLAEAEILKLEANPNDLEAVSAIFRGFHTIKGVAGFLNLKQIGGLAHATEDVLNLGRKSQLAITGATADLILEAADRMKGLLGLLDEAVAKNSPLVDDDRIAALIERLDACLAGNPTKSTEEKSADQSISAKGQVAKDQIIKPAARSSTKETVKVATDRLDSLVNMVGELVIAQSMVAQDVAGLVGANRRLGGNISHLIKIARELQDLSMSMRMVPIQGTFQKVARLVRDLARKAGKEVELVTSGEETELDRNVVEAIEDPLVHMVRNAVDHGIESPEQRRAAGKPAVGRITLSACHEAGNIVVQISDDGRGLDQRRIVEEAVAAGIVETGQELAEHEIFQLIFHAGLSTASSITDISGRGVGMDVVRRNVDALRGRVDIASIHGQGTAFTLRLPLTLALIDGLVARVGREIYILPITNVEQSMQIQLNQLSTVMGKGEMCLIRGQLLPLMRLHQIFGIEGAIEDPARGLAVVVRDHQRRVCLLVDELLGQQQVVIKSLGEAMGPVGGISGGAILGNGNVSLILNVPGLMDISTGRAAPGHRPQLQGVSA